MTASHHITIHRHHYHDYYLSDCHPSQQHGHDTSVVHTRDIQLGRHAEDLSSDNIHCFHPSTIINIIIATTAKVIDVIIIIIIIIQSYQSHHSTHPYRYQNRSTRFYTDPTRHVEA